MIIILTINYLIFLLPKIWI